MVTTYTAAPPLMVPSSLFELRASFAGVQLYLRTGGEDPGEHHPVRCLDSSIVVPRPNRDSPLEARTRQQLMAEGKPWSR